MLSFWFIFCYWGSINRKKLFFVNVKNSYYRVFYVDIVEVFVLELFDEKSWFVKEFFLFF